MGTRTRLEKAVELIARIERKREEQADAGFGTAIENRIIDRELAMLEQDILADPGALKSLLVPVRRRWKGRTEGGL